MVARQILYEWTDGDNPEQIIQHEYDDRDETESEDGASGSKEAHASGTAPNADAMPSSESCAEAVVAAGDANIGEAYGESSNSIVESITPTKKSKPKIESKLPIWRYPDDAILPPRLFMTQRPQVEEKSSAVDDETCDDGSFPRYIFVFRRQAQSSVADSRDELLGEIKIERRTSIAELRRVIIEVFFILSALPIRIQTYQAKNNHSQDFWQRLVFRFELLSAHHLSPCSVLSKQRKSEYVCPDASHANMRPIVEKQNGGFLLVEYYIRILLDLANPAAFIITNQCAPTIH